MKALDRTAFTRNGLPARRDYAYQGTGHDQMPHLTPEDLAPYAVDYSHWLPEMPRGQHGRPPIGEDACPDCGYKQGGRNCRVLCREIRRERLLEATAEKFGATR